MLLVFLAASVMMSWPVLAAFAAGGLTAAALKPKYGHRRNYGYICFLPCLITSGFVYAVCTAVARS